ncbi:regulator of chromosome condensation 1/beta-lactamase-inhibitor protein II [Flammula alnicola]|nr:regulator of chromosome condensation 1/beta-lactamase-inhibitor protein II [Flammula alnicola]
MGSDDYGDLGIGGLKGKKPTTDFHIVQFDHIPSLSETLKVRAMHSGQRHIILYTTSSSSSILLGWGTSRHGQLGSHASTPFASTPQIIITEIDLANDPVTSIALGIHHSVILQESGRLSCHGSDRKGQLQVVKTLPPEAGRIQNIGCTWNGTYVVVQSEGRWNVYSSGSNSHSQLGWNSNGTTSVDVVGFPVTADAHRTAINLACGSEHVLASSLPIQPPSHKLSRRTYGDGDGTNMETSGWGIRTTYRHPSGCGLHQAMTRRF